MSRLLLFFLVHPRMSCSIPYGNLILVRTIIIGVASMSEHKDYAIKSKRGTVVSTYDTKEQAIAHHQYLKARGTNVQIVKRTTTIVEEVINV